MTNLSTTVRPLRDLDWRRGLDDGLRARFLGFQLVVREHEGDARFDEPARYCTWVVEASPDFDLFGPLVRQRSRDLEGTTDDVEAAKEAAYSSVIDLVNGIMADIECCP